MTKLCLAVIIAVTTRLAHADTLDGDVLVWADAMLYTEASYVFIDEAEATDHVPRLWLRGLECRVADGESELRLDDSYESPNKTGWWTAGTSAWLASCS